MSSGQLFQCPECDQEFTLNKNLIRHVNTVHGNESRKDNEARKDGSSKVSIQRPLSMQVLDVLPRWRSSQVPIQAPLRSQLLHVIPRWRSSQVPIRAPLRIGMLEVSNRWHLNHQLIMCHWL